MVPPQEPTDRNPLPVNNYEPEAGNIGNWDFATRYNFGQDFGRDLQFASPAQWLAQFQNQAPEGANWEQMGQWGQAPQGAPAAAPVITPEMKQYLDAQRNQY